MKELILILGIGFSLLSCTTSNTNTKSAIAPKESVDLTKLSKAYFASGCFWCVEAIFESVKGVEEVISGYSGGTEANPTYEQVGSGQSSHAEVVEVYYNPDIISYQTLVEVYYASHNPTTLGQAPDFGKQYRSMILYNNPEEQKIAEDFKAKLTASNKYKEAIITEIVPLKKFWKAEDYHQNYERLNPNSSYVRSVSIPRLNQFKAKFPQLLK